MLQDELFKYFDIQDITQNINFSFETGKKTFETTITSEEDILEEIIRLKQFELDYIKNNTREILIEKTK